MTDPAHPPIDPPDAAAFAEAPEGGLDLARMKRLAGFVLRAPRRRPRLAGAVFAVACLATVAAVLFFPRVYTVTSKILVQRNVVIPLLGNPRRPLPAEWDVPTRGTSETILRRDNLDAIVAETGLVSKWEHGRSPLLKLMDRVVSLMGPVSDEERARALVGTLEKKLIVQADDTTIKITLAWHDPVVAHEIVSCIERRFLANRSATETGAITETIAILEETTARQREDIDAALAGVQERLQALRPRALDAPLPEPVVFGRAPRAPPAPSDSATKLATDLAQKRRAIQELGDAWHRRVADLKAKLQDIRLTYASAHPAVIALEEKIRLASVAPPEILQLEQEEAALLERAKDFAPADGEPRFGPRAALTPAQRAVVADAAGHDDPELTAARTKLTVTVQKYEELKDRVDSARLELITAQAAFKYRYAVVEPSEVPKKPTKPSVPGIVIGGLVLSVALALAAAAAKDFASNRFIEAWQVRRLPIPLLAEVTEPGEPR